MNHRADPLRNIRKVRLPKHPPLRIDVVPPCAMPSVLKPTSAHRHGPVALRERVYDVHRGAWRYTGRTIVPDRS